MRHVAKFSRSRVTLKINTSYTAQNVALTLESGNPDEISLMLHHGNVLDATIVETTTLILSNRPEPQMRNR